VTLRANGCAIPAATYAQVKPCAIKFSGAALTARNAVEMSVLLQYRGLFHHNFARASAFGTTLDAVEM